MALKIAITGGIGSGKSAALACVREMGYTAFSCDEIYVLSEKVKFFSIKRGKMINVLMK